MDWLNRRLKGSFALRELVFIGAAVIGILALLAFLSAAVPDMFGNALESATR